MSNEPRDQLAALAKRIRSQAVISTRPGQLDELERIANDLAALELEFAGWRPPSRVITDPAELDALQSAQHLIDTNRCGHVASAAIIRDANGDVYARDVDNLSDEISEGRHAGWWQIGTGRDDIDSGTVAFPVTVLWEPEETAGEPHRIDVTHVAPGELERMARSGARPSPELRAAIDQARDRKGADRG